MTLQSASIKVLAVMVWSLMMTRHLPSQEIDFARQIRPILNKNCLACHGSDASHRSADLRLDTFEAATDHAIVPGKPDQSEVVRRITSYDEAEVMPPPEHGKLTDEEKKLIEQWIASGAEYTAHWAFQKPQLYEPPTSRHKDWATNEIDWFIGRKLEELGLSPSPPSDWQRLLRRVSLDLTGLPPGNEAIGKLMGSPDLATYESIVDELLKSSAFGEHWGAMWLDLARYADTIGYTEDNPRTIWPYRDWVIGAFNENMPFDRFTIEQIAGDLLPDPTPSQILATSFHRNTLANNEGGTIDEEYRTMAVKDRINTTINVWMGLTMRCAECHTHKFDPISIEEYYQFYDFFNQTADADRRDEEPRMKYESDDQAKRLEELDRQILRVREKIANEEKPYRFLKPSRFASEQKSELHANPDDSISLLGEAPNNDVVTIDFQLDSGTYYGLYIEVMPEPKQRSFVGLSSGGNFILSQVTAKRLDGKASSTLPLSDAAADFIQAGYNVLHIIDSEDDEKGWAVSGAPGGHTQVRSAVLSFESPLIVDQSAEISVSFHFLSKRWPKHIISRMRVGVTDVDQPARKFRENEFDQLAAELNSLQAKREKAAVPIMVPIMRDLEMDKRRTSHIMIRGSYLAPGDPVSAAVPTSFNALPADAPLNRLTVAKWLLDPENPLTARVTVNRFWSRIFGRGIVETEEDFGLQGSLPTHPELLDWIAIDFARNGWDIKRLLKQLVMSSTYRQSSAVTPELLAKDPQNLFFARGPRGRLSAEVVRDQALMVSGLLSRKMQGPPVFPPSPIKVIRNAFAGDFVWETSQGEDRYRRAIYTYLKRSQPHPLFETFDVATRQVCSFRRINTNTPLQSFMTLNDEAFVECAQHLARKMAEQKGTIEQKIRWGLHQALRQPTEEKQVEILQGFVEKSASEFSDDLSAATRLAGINTMEASEKSFTDEQILELASLTAAANVILNMDAFLTK